MIRILKNLLFACFTLFAANVFAQGYEWQEFESVGFSSYGHTLVNVSKEGKKYYYHLDSELLIDEVENQAAGMTVVIKDGNYGVLRDDGMLIVPFAYDGIRLESDYYGQWYEGIPYHYKFVSLEKDGLYGYADSNGQVLAEPIYEQLKVINKQLIAVANDNRWGWLDAATGELLNLCVYEEVNKTYQFDNYVEVRQDGKFGIAKKDGAIVVPITEERIFFPSIVDATYICGYTNGVATLYDSLGNVMLQGDYPALQPGQGGNLFTFRKNDLLGLVDPRSGKVVFEPQFASLRTSVRGLYQVTKGEKNGVVDEHGRWVLPTDFDRVEFVSADGRVKTDAVIYEPAFYTKRGNTITQAHEARIEYEAKMDRLPYYIRGYKDKTVGLFDWEGHPIVPVGTHTSTTPYDYDGKAYFIVGNRDDAMGFLEASGKELLPVQYGHRSHYQYNTNAIETRFDLLKRYVDVLDEREDGVYPARIGLFDLKKATWVIEPCPQSIEWLNEGYFKAIRREGDYSTQVSLYDAEGKRVLDFDEGIKEARMFNNGLLLAEREKEYGDGIYVLLDTTGKVIYENPKWSIRKNFGHIRFPENERWDPYDFHVGLKKIYTGEANLFVDETGSERRFPYYEQVDGFFGGHALVGKEVEGGGNDPGFWFGGSRYLFGLIDSAGAEVFPPVWHSVHAHANDPYLLQVQQGDKFGLIDRRGEIVLKTEYDHIESSDYRPYLQIKKGGKIGLMTSDGRVVIEPRYEMVRTNAEGVEKTWPLLVKENEWHYFMRQDGKRYPIRAKAYTY